MIETSFVNHFGFLFTGALYFYYYLRAILGGLCTGNFLGFCLGSLLAMLSTNFALLLSRKWWVAGLCCGNFLFLGFLV